MYFYCIWLKVEYKPFIEEFLVKNVFICGWTSFYKLLFKISQIKNPGGGTHILGHIRDVRPEWVSFQGRKPADGCKFLTKNLRMGHNFDIILPGNG